jgi:hypothetical protein
VGQQPEGEVTEPADTGFETGIEETPPTDFGTELGGELGGGETPETGGAAEVTPESLKRNDLNLIIEDNELTGTESLDLSKGKKSIQEIEGKLNELLNN